MRSAAILALSLLLPAAEASAGEAAGLDDCRARFAMAPDQRASAACFADVGMNQGQAGEAAREIEGLLSRAPAGSPRRPWLLFYLGSLQWAEPERAERPYRAAAAAFAARGDAEGEVVARVALHSLLMKLGRSEEAGAEAAQTALIARRAGDPLLTALSQVLEARHLRLTGQDLERATLLLHRAEAAAFARGSYSLERDCLEELAIVNHAVGRLAEERSAYSRLARLAAQQGERRTEAIARYGALRALMEELTEIPRPAARGEAVRLAREVLDAASSVGYHELAGRAHLVLGRLTSRAEAAGHLERCLMDLVTAKDRSLCLAALAERQRREGDLPAADQSVREALALADQAHDPWSRAEAWRERMRVSWEALPRAQALADARSALGAIETIRDRQRAESSRAGLSALWSEDYYWLSGRLLEAGDAASLDQAFGVMERLRARTLVEALEAAHASPGAGNAEEPIPVDSWRLGVTVLPQVRQALAPDEALLSYQIAPDATLSGDFGGGSWLLVSTRSGMRAFRLHRDRVALRPAVALFNGLFERRDGSEVRPSTGLYRDLLAEGLSALPPTVRRLVIVPDDAVHQLPFSALRSGATVPVLAGRYEISVAPSATLWLRWRQRRPAPPPEPLLALADPQPPGQAAGRPSSERAAFLDEGVRLGALPFAREEGRSAVRHLGGGSVLRLGREASEGFLKSADLQRFGVLHFATHAVMDDQHPERSGVLLTPDPDGGEDGLLLLREIVRLPLEGRIVVLSSCRSASGQMLRGEGVMGLARAFFQAGAHTVVASLWPLRDDDGAALFDRFYLHLAQGQTVAAALRDAQRDRITAGAPAYAWAGLVVLGDGDLAPLPGGRRTEGLGWSLAAVGAALLLLAAGVLVWRRPHLPPPPSSEGAKAER